MFLSRAAVIGAGPLGAEIADTIASAKIPVELITDASNYGALRDVEIAIEAVPDELELKRTVFAELDQATPGHAILASSTSTLSITEIGEATSRPDKVVGLHFFDPPSVVRAVEVIEGVDTSPETMQSASSFVQAIRKMPIRAFDSPGFVVGRIIGSASSESSGYRAHAGGEVEELDTLKALVESCLVLEEGLASMKDIDLGLSTVAGLRPPPFAGADQVGLDHVLARLERAATEWGEGFEPPMILRRLVAQGRLGVASGQGFFAYPQPDPGWEDSPVKLESRGEIAIGWLDRPPANSISPDVLAALRRLWDAVTADARVRAVIFASANPMLFSAGADIKAFTQMDAAAGAALVEGMHGLLLEMERSSVVTIAAVGAPAFGGGCELAMGCDLRIAADSATFGQPEINLGIIPGFGGTQRLPRLIGESAALEMSLTGDPIDSARAFELGLVNRVVPDHELIDTALLWARKLAGQAPLALEQIKRVSAAGDLEAGLAAERRAFATAFGSADAREGLAAFLQKRPATFTGQ